MKLSKDFKTEALNALNGRWGLAVGGGLLASLLGGGLDQGSGSGFSNAFNSSRYTKDIDELSPAFIITFAIVACIILIVTLVLSFIGSAVQLGYIQFNMNYLDQRKNPSINDLFCRFKIIWKAFGLQLVMGIFIFLWSLLLIVPGIIAAFSYAMAPYILSQNPDIGIMEAINRSKEMMHGNRWRLFCLQISFIGWGILALFTCCIGYLWLTPYIAVSTTAFYNEISGNNIMQYETVDQYYTPGNDLGSNDNAYQQAPPLEHRNED
jgi:uncharacterized membrane protein